MVLVVGSLTDDTNTVNQTTVGAKVGGVVWYAGRVLCELEVATRVLCSAAPHQEQALNELRLDGVDVVVAPSREATTFVNAYRTDRPGERCQRLSSMATPIGVETVCEHTQDVDLLYLGPLHPNDIAPDLSAAVRGKTLPAIALDVQGYCRTVGAEAQVVPLVNAELPELLAYCRYLHASEAEACLVTGEKTARDAARRLSERYPNLESVVTRGGEGVVVRDRREHHDLTGESLDIEDPTGAGDAFFAAYLANRLYGYSMASAAERANRYMRDWFGGRQRAGAASQR